MDMVGEAGREIVVTPAKHFRKRGVQCYAPPWENFPCLSSWQEVLTAASRLGAWDSKPAKE